MITAKFNILRSAIFAGILIGIAGLGFLISKSIGMFLFIFGLAAVVSYGVKLYTGTAGFINYGNYNDIIDLIIILFGNIIGCFIISLIARFNIVDVQSAADIILTTRLTMGGFGCFINAIGCGVLMSAAVDFARQGKDFGYWTPLLLAVPLFIHCGFPHCIADAFYYLTCHSHIILANITPLIIVYICTVFGNLLGCNLYKIAKK